jgi:PKD repeat protein
VDTPFSYPLVISKIDAEDVKDHIVGRVGELGNVGAMIPKRSAVDQAIINDVKNNTTSSWDPRSITYPNIPIISRPANYDTDRDGMPNEWENQHAHLNPDVADNNGDHDNDGYTNLEEYHHHLSGGMSTPVTLTADFSQSSTEGQFPLTVEFDGSLSKNTEGSIVSYEWDFGDGGTGPGVTSSHTYTQSGDYTVTLTVTDDEGNTAVKSKTLTLTAPEKVAHWKLDEGQGNVVKDSTGKHPDSPMNGAEWITDGNRTALLFKEPTDYVQLPMTHMNGKAGTVALWAKPEYSDSSRMRAIFYHTTFPAWNDRIHLFTDVGSDGLILGLGDDHFMHRDIAPMPQGVWRHIAFSWEEDTSTAGTGTYHVYIDGEHKATGTYSGFSTVGEYADIGNEGNPERRQLYGFDGLIDDVQMFNYALSKEEIEGIASGVATTPPPQSPAGLRFSLSP